MVYILKTALKKFDFCFNFNIFFKYTLFRGVFALNINNFGFVFYQLIRFVVKQCRNKKINLIFLLKLIEFFYTVFF